MAELCLGSIEVEAFTESAKEVTSPRGGARNVGFASPCRCFQNQKHGKIWWCEWKTSTLYTRCPSCGRCLPIRKRQRRALQRFKPRAYAVKLSEPQHLPHARSVCSLGFRILSTGRPSTSCRSPHLSDKELFLKPETLAPKTCR